jgi:hypothetical protein
VAPCPKKVRRPFLLRGVRRPPARLCVDCGNNVLIDVQTHNFGQTQRIGVPAVWWRAYRAVCGPVIARGTLRNRRRGDGRGWGCRRSVNARCTPRAVAAPITNAVCVEGSSPTGRLRPPPSTARGGGAGRTTPCANRAPCQVTMGHLASRCCRHPHKGPYRGESGPHPARRAPPAVGALADRTGRAGNRRKGTLSALRAHKKPPYRGDLVWETLRSLKRPGRTES